MRFYLISLPEESARERARWRVKEGEGEGGRFSFIAVVFVVIALLLCLFSWICWSSRGLIGPYGRVVERWEWWYVVGYVCVFVCPATFFFFACVIGFSSLGVDDVGD